MLATSILFSDSVFEMNGLYKFLEFLTFKAIIQGFFFDLFSCVSDKSMEIMFGNGDSVVVIETIKWLESDSSHLKLSACLAIGNFARSGKCAYHDMVIETWPSMINGCGYHLFSICYQF